MVNEFERSIRASNAIVQEIRPILAGESPEVVGAALCNCWRCSLPRLRRSGAKACADY
jgi:hypothetical protein